MLMTSCVAESSFAYPTVKERMPSIVARVADTAFRSKSWIKEKYGEDGSHDLKSLAGCVSKLRNEMMTGKVLVPIHDGRSDVQLWNDYLKEVTERDGEEPAWFISPWLYVECYMYRRIQEGVEKCHVLHKFDVFMEQKQKALLDSAQAILILLNYLMTVVNDLDSGETTNTHKLFKQLMQISLWGNKCDLSISGGQDNAQTSCPLDQVNKLREFVLRDDLEQVWQHLSCKAPCRVDIVLDNAGFELVTDLCLAEFLMSAKLASSVHLHAKAFPWFVSDVTKDDLDYTFQHFMQNNSMAMDMFVKRWKERLEDGSWTFEVHEFWTSPFPYCDMKKYMPDLYTELGNSSLIIFKGDLNYRKLVGDRNWPTTTPFEESLCGFHPAPLCALRTLKADLVTGLEEGQAEKVKKQDKHWMINGNWAVAVYCEKIVQ
ncbi:damage-control phosphatase ARMT1-like isoform X2 [Mercenaria mercenaria]|uniref:damage-control phosphatase ARMT1-like isoform X2 n=1 Tax=Mercenaria mercenaria TaxID=6596 RepID=UPI00234E4B33|nr:damage-control phosphatase ARMT1-like isoform X2 [Mercenaria mercenaria]